MSDRRPRLLHLDAALLGDGGVVRDAAVVLDGARVLDVGRAEEVMPRATGATPERLHGVVMPGLVNAHAHLELSGLRGATVFGAGFVPWLESMQAARLEELEQERDAAIERALAELVSAGVAAVGEVTNDLVAVARLSRVAHATVFHELFALDAGQGRRRLAMMAEQRAALDAVLRAPTVRYVVVPHALYSTHPELVREVVSAADPDGPLTVHLAEHAAERAFLADGGGPLARFFAQRGLAAALAAFPLAHQGPVAYARALGLLRRGAALVHLADARAEELDLVAEAGAYAVLCPRSNLHIEARLPPLDAMLSRGVAIALGSDSLASAPSLDPLADARALCDRFPEVPAATLLAAACWGGARAIGFGASLGRIAPGLAPGIVYVATEAPLAADVDPAAWLLGERGAARRWLARPGGLEPDGARS